MLVGVCGGILCLQQSIQPHDCHMYLAYFAGAHSCLHVCCSAADSVEGGVVARQDVAEVAGQLQPPTLDAVCVQCVCM